MDFGVGFLSNNVMLPILDFFYGLAPSYGLAIIALTLVVRVAVFPLSAGSIRNARRMKIVNPLMQERQKEVKERYKDDPAKQQEEVAKIFKEFGNPLAGCLPVLFQMPILFALFATLRGSPFSDINYALTVQVLPQDQMVQVQPQAFTSPPQNIYVNDGDRTKIVAVLPGGSNIGVGEKVRPNFQTVEGKPFAELAATNPETDLTPVWSVTKGNERVQVNADGSIEALQPGEATIQGTIPGLASNKGFLFIKKLGQVGVRSPDGAINWDIAAMALAFGLSLYLSQQLSGAGNTGNPQQDQASKLTTLIFSGMFLFFPLPAGVLMYMVIGNLFQTFQTFLLMKEPLPDNIQAMLDAQTEKAELATQDRLPFEPKKKKA
jgi:YidC/Oxa1 family membrane protein insertase